MKIRNKAVSGCLVMACLGIADERAWGIGGGAMATAAYAFVGRAQGEDTAPGDHVGTGSFIRPGIVLTAAHNSDVDVLSNAYLGSFERFQLPGGAQKFALPVWEPGYAIGPGQNDDDQALWYVINAEAPAAFGQVWDGIGGGGFPAVGDEVHVIGFTGSANNGNPLDGKMKVKSSTLKLITLTDNPNFTQAGDSGGPYIRSIGGTEMIVASHRSGNAKNNPGAGNYSSDGVRVDEPSHQSFILGDGIGGSQVFDRMTDTGSGFYGVSARWARGSAGAHFSPMSGDVAILDPTTNSDTGTLLQVDSDAPTIFGLASDVRFLVRAKLRVSGQAGVVNTGIMGADDAASKFDVDFQFDNAGTLTLTGGAVMTVGSAAPRHPVNLFQYMFLNVGTTAVKALTTVGPGGTLDARASDAVAKSAIRNQGMATFVVAGNATAAAVAKTDVFQNEGTLSVGPAGTLTVGSATMLKAGTVDVTGSGAGTATFAMGGVTQDAGTVTIGDKGVATALRGDAPFPAGDTWVTAPMTKVTVKSGGKLTVSAGGQAPVGQAINTEAGGDLSIEAGGEANFRGNSAINAGLDITGGATTRGILNVTGAGAADGSLFLDTKGVLNFGAGATAPRLALESSDLRTTGTTLGKGTIQFTLNSSYVNRTDAPTHLAENSNGISLEFNTALNGAAPVTLEVPCDDAGAVAGALFDAFAFNELCITQGSKVKLVDAFQNEPKVGNEVFYTKLFGIDANSTLDLNGFTIYYQALDPDCGGLAGTVTKNGGMLIMIPEPSPMVWGAPLLGLTRRRRRGP